MVAVEAAEDKAVLRQSRFRPAGDALGHAAMGIVALVAVGKIGDLLGIETAILIGNDDAVGEQIVDISCAHSAGVAKIMDLNRCRTQGKDSRTCAAGIAFQIDGDVDFHRAQFRGDLCIALGAHIEEAVEGRFQSFPHIAFIVGPKRDGKGLKPLPIMMFEHARHQECRRMRIEIGGKIGDADLVVGIALISPQGRGRFGISIGRKNPRGLQLFQGGCGDRQVAERMDDACAGAQRRCDLRPRVVQFAPIAAMQPRMHQETARIGIIGIEGEQCLAIARGFLEPL